MNTKRLRPKIVVFSATTGAGKTTIMFEILMRYTETTTRIVTYTTRLPRTGEIDGMHYYFCSKESFEARIKDGAFIEWAVVYGHYYGTSMASISNALKRKDVVTFVNLDVQGHKTLRANPLVKESMLSIFIDVPLEQLRGRLTNRGEEPAVIVSRLMEAAIERESRHCFDVRINNEDGRLHEAIMDTIGLLGLDD